MALLWTDGFDRYTAIGDLTTEWFFSQNPNTPIFNATGGVVNNGPNLQISNTFRSFYRSFPTAATLTAGGTVHFGIWIKITSYYSFISSLMAPGTNLQWPDAFSGVNTLAARLDMDQFGTLTINKHGVNTVVGTSAVGAITTGVWHFVEYAAKYNTFANGGYIKVWVDGNLVCSSLSTSADTNSGTVPTTWTGVQFCVNNSATRNMQFDDPIMWDEVGTDFALTQISATYLPFIETLSPDGDDTVQFTKSTGATNASNVDETGVFNSDTDYNYSSTIGHEDLLTVANPSGTPAIVFGLAVKTEAKTDAAGILNLRTKLKSGATTTYSADRLLGTGYLRYTDFYGKDPDTSAVWATTAPAAVKVGYKYQS